MIRLKDRFAGKTALNIMGGPSILKNKYDLSQIDKDKHIIFLESKALTPKFLEFGIEPDFYLMFFPEKCQTNSLQHLIYQALLVDIDLSNLLREEWLGQYNYFKQHSDKYFEAWNPEGGLLFKKIRWKKDVRLENSPFSLMPRIPHSCVITRLNELNEFYNSEEINRSVYFYDYRLTQKSFELEEYFNPKEENSHLVINNYSLINSAAGALFPLQKYMGFKKICFIGMDMSLLGSMEYSVLYTFKSMDHFRKFFDAARQVYCHNFPRGIQNGLTRFVSSVSSSISERKFNKLFSSAIYNELFYDIWGLKGKFMRDRGQFRDCKELFSYDGIKFENIYEPFKYARKVPGARNISYGEFLNN